MDWVNYHHLLYFWVVAKEGTVTKAAEVLRLRQPTVSEQLKNLEESLGEQLFDRSRRRLTLTDSGRLVYRYADEIFRLGQELKDTLAGRPTGRPSKLRVGVSDAVPKLVLQRLLEPALRMEEPV
ncbi:MAG: LysR family transcriptional regulator, partial [Deltaproteobacteria bacterium]|nr:LysR family transcriptional regulator [Deltaproteobacteria bacterium]